MRSRIFLTMIAVLLGAAQAVARPYYYPQLRYLSGEGAALGGMALPLTDELSNNLFNNPAALAKNEKFRAEVLNLNLEGNAGLLGTVGLNTGKMTSLSGMASTLQSNPGKLIGGGIGNVTALSWGGFGVGVLYQRRARAVYDGKNIQYETVNQFIPALGYGLSLARGVMRVGYALQYVNESYGQSTVAAANATTFAGGIGQGYGLSHNASVNFTFPFTYLPSVFFEARNIGGLHYNKGGMLTGASNTTPKDEPMSLDASFSLTVRMSGTFKARWLFQYKDFAMSEGMPYLDHLSAGLGLGIGNTLELRGGTNGTHPSFGLGYKSTNSEINVSWYSDPNPFSAGLSSDSRYVLQYKLFFQDKNARNRDADTRGTKQ